MTPGAAALIEAAARRRGAVFIGQTADDSLDMATGYAAEQSVMGWQVDDITAHDDGRVTVQMHRGPE